MERQVKRIVHLLLSKRFRNVGGGLLAILLIAAVLFAYFVDDRSMKEVMGDLRAQKSDTSSPSMRQIPKGFEITQIDADRSSWTWSKAKSHAVDVWQAQLGSSDTLSSFYCGCNITRRGKSGGEVDFESCGYRSRGNLTRAQRLEWEHVVPAAFIGQGRSCWQTGAAQCVDSSGKPFKGRSCCMIADPSFAMAANDPVNLVPAVGEVNADRSNYAFGMIEGESRNYGMCDMEVDSTQRLSEPPADRRGDIARVYAYMSKAYGLPLSREQAELYTQWIAQDPVSAQEVRINRSIRATGHRANPFVLSP